MPLSPISSSSPASGGNDVFNDYSNPGVIDAVSANDITLMMALVSPGGSGSTAYFSVNNGSTSLGSWNNDPNNGDLGDWYPSGPAGLGLAAASAGGDSD